MSTHETQQVTHEFRVFRVYKDGRLEFLKPIPDEKTPPGEDPVTGVCSKDVTISTDPPVSARIFLPRLQHPSRRRKLPVLVYAHGGAFCRMSAFSSLYHRHCSALTTAVEAIVVSADYGLFPARPIPACYDDSWAVLQWVAAHVDGTGPEPWLNQHADLGRLFVGGDSSGGNITHTLAFRAGSVGLPAGANLVGAIMVHPFFGGTDADEMWLYMCPTNIGGLDDPRMNPPGEDLARLGCERVLIFVAGKDPYKGPGEGYFERLKRSGWKGTVKLVENEGQGHVFHLMPGADVDKARDLIQEIVSFIKQG